MDDKPAWQGSANLYTNNKHAEREKERDQESNPIGNSSEMNKGTNEQMNEPTHK